MNRGLSLFLLVLTMLLLPLYFLFVQKRSLPHLENHQSEKSEEISLKMDDHEEQQTLRALSSHFPDEIKALVHVAEPRQEIEVPVSKGPLLTSTVKYISTVIKSEVKHYYFKIVRSGEILDLTRGEGRKGWLIINVETDFFILTFEDNTYKVMR